MVSRIISELTLAIIHIPPSSILRCHPYFTAVRSRRQQRFNASIDAQDRRCWNHGWVQMGKTMFIHSKITIVTILSPESIVMPCSFSTGGLGFPNCQKPRKANTEISETNSSLDVRAFANMRLDNVYRSRSPTNHVTFLVDDAQRKIGKHRRWLKRKMEQQIKSGEGRLTRLEARIRLYEDRFREMEDEDDLMTKYKELSEAQNYFIEAQKTRILELEKQGTAHAGELSRTCQLNRDLSATIHCQNMTICDLQKRLAEGASNYAAIATLFQDHDLHESLSLDSKGLNHATQDDIFTDFFASNHNTSYATEVADSATSQKFNLADSLSPNQWLIKELASPNSQRLHDKKNNILKEDGFAYQI